MISIGTANPARAVLFDYGGTLDGAGWHWFDRMVHIHRELGSAVDEDRLKEAFYAANERMATEAPRERFGLRAMLERHVAMQRERLGGDATIDPSLVEAFCAMTEEGWAIARTVVERLAREVRVGVVSNFAGNLEVLLAEAGLLEHLATVVESARVGLHKPDPAIYRLAVERLGLPPASIVMVGDNLERDCRPARELGLATVWLRRPDQPATMGDGLADLVITDLRELLPPA